MKRVKDNKGFKRTIQFLFSCEYEFLDVFNICLNEHNQARAENRQETYKQLNLFGDVLILPSFFVKILYCNILEQPK